MNHWMLKTEPASFSLEELSKRPKRTTHWDGVRNYQARNTLRDDMKVGDEAFIYYSSCAAPGIAGIVRITRGGYPDHTAQDKKHEHYDPAASADNPRWYMVDVQLVRRLSRIITLEELRAHANGKLKGMVLLRAGNRLSVMPVERTHWRFVLTLE